MHTRSLLFSTIALSTVLFGSRPASAACVIAGLRPNAVALPTMDAGQQFVFIATADCETLRFRVPGSTLTKIPKDGPDTGSKDRTYKVVLTQREWNSAVDESDIEFRWSITGTTSAGVTTRVTMRNALDFDRDGWFRGGGDVGACDYSPARNPGAAEICDGVDQDCDGLIDEDAGTWFRDADGDGYGDDTHRRCDWADGYVEVGGDCDDRDSTLWCFDLSRADAKLVGEDNEFAGVSLSGAGDVDSDGHDDLLIGSYGTAYLVLGPVTGTVDLSVADARLSASDGAGPSVSGAGDVDGDGNDDLLIGANSDSDGGSYAGAAYVVLGPVSGTFDLASADAKLVGESAGDQAGDVVSDAGDFDGDGHADLLIGAEGDDEGGSSAGAAYIVLGPVTGTRDLSLADAKLVGENPDDEVGAGWTSNCLSGAGDVDGDGNDDVLIGAVGNSMGGWYGGAAYLVLGPVTGTLDLSLADAKLAGRTSAGVGWSVSSAGDVDADGHDDLLIGAPGTGYKTYLFLGPVTGHLKASSADATFGGDTNVGWSVSDAGDVDGEGHADILIGAPGTSAGGYYAGAAYLVLGPVSGNIDLPSQAELQFVGEDAYDNAGDRVSGAGDVDGDGLDDVLISAYGNSEGGSDYAGAAYLVLGGGL